MADANGPRAVCFAHAYKNGRTWTIIHDTPFQSLHAAHGTADNDLDARYLELVKQLLLPHHITNGNLWKVDPVSCSRFRVDIGRTRSAVAAAQCVGTDDEVLISIESFSRTKKSVKPLISGCIPRQGMTYKHHIVAFFIELTPRLIGNRWFR